MKILRVARADLDNVGVFRHQFRVVFGKQFGDDGQTGCLARFGQQLQPPFAQSLKFVRRRARFECAAAENRGAGGLHGFGGGEQLLLAFHRAWAGHDLNFSSADHNAPRVDRGVGRVRLAADELETLLHRHDALHHLRKQRDQAFEAQQVRAFGDERQGELVALAAQPDAVVQAHRTLL